MLVAQLTDIHMTADGPVSGVDPAANLQRFVDRINALEPRPDAVVVTGDLTADGDAAACERLAGILGGLAVPWYPVPGNHDVRAVVRSTFAAVPGMPREGFLCYTADAGPARLILLDTLHEGRSGGRVCLDRLYWLERAVEDAGARPVMIFMHHPPILTGLAAFDAEPLEGSDAFGSVLHGHPNVLGIACGHLHRMMAAHWHGQTVVVAPSTAFHVALDLAPGAPLGLSDEAPGALLHQWRVGAGYRCHLLRA